MQSGGTIKGPVIEVVKGGLILDIGLRGFLPASLVDLRRVRDLHPFVGTELEAKIIELDRNRNNVVLSRRAFLEESQSEGRKKFLESLQKGERRKGTVSSIVNFGAFVDLGGVDGLVHVSELSWKHVDHPSEVVAGRPGGRGRGARRRPRARARVALAEGDAGGPLEGVRAEVPAGEIIDGQVTKLVPFGAFVRVGAGHRGSGAHLRDLRTSTSRRPRGPVGRRPGPRQGDRGGRAAPAHQPVDAAGRRRDASSGDRDRGGGGRRGGGGGGLGFALFGAARCGGLRGRSGRGRHPTGAPGRALPSPPPPRSPQPSGSADVAQAEAPTGDSSTVEAAPSTDDAVDEEPAATAAESHGRARGHGGHGGRGGERGGHLARGDPGGPEAARRARGLAPVLLVGLTGGIGSGKSTVARLLEERGAVVFDADAARARGRRTRHPGSRRRDRAVRRGRPRARW